MGIRRMQKEGKKGFTFNLSSKGVDDPTKEEILVLTENKGVSKRFIYIVIAGFLVLIAVLAWSYHDLQKTLNAVNRSGSEVLEELARELNGKIAQLSQQMADQKSATQNRLMSIDASIKSINAVLTEIKANKSNKTEVAVAIEEIQNSIALLRKNAEIMNLGINDLAGKADSTISSIKKAQAVIQQNRQDIEMLNAKSVDHATLEAALNKEREFNQENMAHATEALFSEIASLQKAVKALTGKPNGAVRTDTVQPPNAAAPSDIPATDNTVKQKQPSTPSDNPPAENTLQPQKTQPSDDSSTQNAEKDLELETKTRE